MPGVVSHGHGGGFAASFDWVGTRDLSSWLAVPAGIAFLEGIGAGGIRAGQLREPLGLLLAVGGLTAEVLDHPAGGIGLGGQGRLVAFLGQQGGLQVSEGLRSGVVVIGFETDSRSQNVVGGRDGTPFAFEIVKCPRVRS